MLKKIFFLFYLDLFFLLTYLYATEVKGIVTDQNNSPLPFANVYIKSTSIGTTTNMLGEFSMDILPGEYQLVFQFIGYKKHFEKIKVGEGVINLQIKLQSESYQLREIVIKSNQEDPAYPIMRKVIAKRKYHLRQVEAFFADVYIKGLQRLTRAPKKILGQTVNIDGLDSLGKGIVYLSESESKLYYQRPDHYREIMYSSKVSGDNRAFSWNQASEMGMNFYENRIDISDLGDRGFISPLAESGLFYYRYKLAGTFEDNNRTVYKIEVTPKRKSDPVFHGFIFINDSLWNLNTIDLTLTKEAGINFIDTLQITQTHIALNDSVWMPISQNFYFFFKLFGFEGNGNYIGVLRNYEINPNLPENFFTNEIIEVKPDANKKDSAYWSSKRPVPLTQEEDRDYLKKDSLEIVFHSKPYLDSIDRKSNKVNIMKLFLSGYTYLHRYKKHEFNFSPLIENVGYNTVEGLILGLSTDFTKRLDGYEENRKWYSVSSKLKYGFSNKLNASLGFTYNYDPLKRSIFKISVGRDVQQFGTRRELKNFQIKEPIHPFLNTTNTLLYEHNFMKIYEKVFGGFAWSSEIVNGVYFLGNMEYANRSPLKNKSEYYTWIDYKTREFTPNIDFEKNNALTVSMYVRLRYKQKYYNRPDRKIIIGSKYPDFNISYKKGINELGSSVNYDLLEAGFDGDLNFGLFGNSNYNGSIGMFLNARRMQFMDYRHFLGNRTIVSNGYLTAFQLLDYYKYSIGGISSEYQYFAEGHFEHHFNGFIFNKIPLWRKLKIQEVSGFHLLYTQNKKEYMEVSVGLENILKVARIDFITSFNNYTNFSIGLRLGINLLVN